MTDMTTMICSIENIRTQLAEILHSHLFTWNWGYLPLLVYQFGDHFLILAFLKFRFDLIRFFFSFFDSFFLLIFHSIVGVFDLILLQILNFYVLKFACVILFCFVGSLVVCRECFRNHLLPFSS